MNYIKKLENNLNEVQESRIAAHIAINDLTKYITSEKFNCGHSLDGYVHISDISTRLRSITEALMSHDDRMV